jgi:hypothetical protein
MIKCLVESPSSSRCFESFYENAIPSNHTTEWGPKKEYTSNHCYYM